MYLVIVGVILALLIYLIDNIPIFDPFRAGGAHDRDRGRRADPDPRAAEFSRHGRWRRAAPETRRAPVDAGALTAHRARTGCCELRSAQPIRDGCPSYTHAVINSFRVAA